MMTKATYNRYQAILKEKQVSKLWATSNEDLQEVYAQWETKVMTIKKTCEKKRGKPKDCKKITDLRRAKKRIRGEMESEKNEQETDTMRKRLQLLSHHIDKEKLEQNTRKICKTVNMITKEGRGVNENAFWKYKRQTEQRKTEYKTAMLDSNGQRVEDEESVKKVYTDFYKTLLETPKADTQEEEQAEEQVNNIFESIRAIAEKQLPIEISQDIVMHAIKNLKRKKASDNQGWTNEMIIDGGEEMVISITRMFNEITKKQEIPRTGNSVWPQIMLCVNTESK